MGMIGRFLGAGGGVRAVGEAVTGVAEVFVGNRAEREAAEHAAFAASLGQYGAEFAQARNGWFDGFVNGLNRLPRPTLALGTLGLFVYAMAEPAGFSVRMQGLALVPEPLWWLLGAIVSFYFGARELHYRRCHHPGPVVAARSPAPTPFAAPPAAEPPAPRPAQIAAAPVSAAETMRASDPNYNAAIEEWRRQRG